MATRKRAPSDEYASDHEVEAAISVLSKADVERLLRYANYRAFALVGSGLGLSAEDLLQEAIVRTIAGQKKWRRTVSFVKHLKQAMRNMAGHASAATGGARTAEVVEERDAEDRDVEVLRSSTHNGERCAAVREMLERMARTFESDEEVWLVMQGLADGKKGPEIQRELNITETQYETIMTRLRRGVDREQGWRP